ncbi:MAG TPA: hypothetical protein VMN81_05035 [Vicinamibacterales bacterium]|nr:hypothetical protein [Vicinamibacterales bacterium]
MTHPLVLALFNSPAAAAAAATALHAQGIDRADLSVIARSHAEEVEAARALDATPGVEMEDSMPAARLGELSAHVLAAMALVMPGVGPVIAGGPLAAEMGEAAGHVAGSLADHLERAGLERPDADVVEAAVEKGGWLLGVHVRSGDTAGAVAVLGEAGATLIHQGRWKG